MDAFRSAPAWARARDFVCLAIFARRGASARTIGLADIAGLRGILRDVVARILGLIGGDRVELVGLLGIDLLGRALLRTARQQGQAGSDRNGQAGPHLIPRSNGRSINARAAIWGAA